MSFDPVSTNDAWNYSNPNRDGYSPEITGTVLGFQKIQAREYNPNDNKPGKPKFWPEGNPMMNIRMILCGPQGGIRTFTFQPASKEQQKGQKPSIHMDLYHLTGDTALTNLIGNTIHIKTWEMPNGGKYGSGNPRPFAVELVPGVAYQPAAPLNPEYLLPEVYANEAVSGGQFQQQPDVPQMQAGAYAAPQAQPVQPVQPIQAQPMAQPQQPMQPIQPQIDPAVQANTGGLAPQAQPMQPQVQPQPQAAPVAEPAQPQQVQPVPAQVQQQQEQQPLQPQPVQQVAQPGPSENAAGPYDSSIPF